MMTDTDRLNWLDAHPSPAEIKGGVDDGREAIVWGISAYVGNIRDAIDQAVLMGKNVKQKAIIE